MAMNKLSVRFNIRGVDEIKNKIKQLPRLMARTAVRRGVTEAIQDLNKEAKAIVPVEEGFLKKALGYKVKAYKNGLGYFGLVGARKDAKGSTTRRFTHYAKRRSRPWAGKHRIAPYKYHHLVEGGTRPHATGKGSRLRTGVQIPPFHPGARKQPRLREAAIRMQVNSIRKISDALSRWIGAYKQGRGRP